MVLYTVPVDLSCQLPSQRIEPSSVAHLTNTQRDLLLAVLDKFRDCFLEKPGLCTLVEHEIIMSPEFVPKRARAYKIAESLKDEVDKQIATLLSDGFIRHSSSPQASPIVCVLKKTKVTQSNGSNQNINEAVIKPEVRLAIDYRYLNGFTQAFPFPVPDQQTALDSISRFNVISVFDVRASYWQTPIKREHQWLSAFICHSGLYEWCRTPYGMKNSGSTLLAAIHRILQPLRHCTVSFVDDIAVGSSTFELHIQEHLPAFLTAICKSGLTLNLRKTEFVKPEVTFVGHVVGSGHKRPDPNRLEAINRLVRPHTKKELRSTLGLLGYHRLFVPNYADIAKPLTDLTSKKCPAILPWTDVEQRAFECLKESLCLSTALHTPRIGELYVLRTDASAVAIGSILSQLTVPRATVNQVDVKGQNEQPIAYFSQKLTATQQRWSTIEREAYAVIASLERFHNLIFGSVIVVFCDHNPLAYIVDSATKSAKLTRWSLALQEYHLIFRYVKAAHNVVADCLSRNSFWSRTVAALAQR